ncbi:MAG: Maltodextrin phosphorylase, partial [Verrucomicrobiota bacterium]
MPTAPKKKATAKAQPATTAKPAKAVRSVAPQRPSARRAVASLANTGPFPAADIIHAIDNQPASADKPADAFRSLIQRHLVSTLARHPGSANSRDWWIATALAVRDTIHERMIATQAVHNAHNARRIYYFSLEYLMGRLFGNNLIATGLLDTAKEALESLGQDFEEIRESEVDMGLGNGGLG